MNFQQIIFALNQFWEEHGCVILQPYDMEVGAGTFHPATFLGAIGPEPTRAAYVQPSRRPTDGRYGDNPNRLQHYFQYQVVLKPSPSNFQQLYLESLRRLGVDPLLDDIRFVEDDWESPTLGAWGLGWEVWLNGMEITQVTYFQQVGALECRPVTGEITYGLERIAMYVQGVNDVFDLDWNGDVRYGDLYHQNEFEQSKYNFEAADTENLFRQFNACEIAGNRLTELKLPLPAYEQVLRASHIFNLLDARRTIGVTERAVYIGRVRTLARNVAHCYYESRQSKNFPRLRESATADSKELSTKSQPPATNQPETLAPLLVEFGTEELPPQAIPRLGAALESELKNALLEVHLIASIEESSKWYATPRRIAVVIENVQSRRDDVEKIRRGPSVDKAYDENGLPSKAAQGFASACGVAFEALETLENENGKFLAYRFIEHGKSGIELIPNCVKNAVSRLPVPKRMRWGELDHEFVRPVHWVMLLHGEQVIPCEIFGIASGNQTEGHRFHGKGSLSVKNAGAYVDVLRQDGSVIVDRDDRKASIQQQILELASQFNGTVLKDENLLNEVTDLVEWPFTFCGTFSSEFLRLPPEVLMSSMRKHQKYFPVFDKKGLLLPKFFGVANIEPAGEEETRRITVGNERVLQARLSDARFFWEQDRKTRLEEKLPALETLVFHRKIGPVSKKVERIEKLAVEIAKYVAIDEMAVRDASRLAKADLVSEMVGEFPDLQGVMGRYYAQLDGYPQAVCSAIEEHYLPVSASGDLPQTDCGIVVAIADRIDSLVGLTCAGEVVKGDRDPFSIRRMALAVLTIIIEREVDLDVMELLQMAAEIYREQSHATDSGVEISPDPNDLDRLFEFILERLRHYYLEQSYSPDEFSAVYDLRPSRPLEFDKRLRAVRQFRELDEYSDLIAANKRIRNILNRASVPNGTEVDPDLLTENAELVLYRQAIDLRDQVSPLVEQSRHAEILRMLSVLREPIDQFFDNVMVMDENPDLQRNRIALVDFVCGLFRQVAELSKLQPTKAK